MSIKIIQSYYASLNEKQQLYTYLVGYFVISLISWSITNQASAYTAVWLGSDLFGEFSTTISISHNLAHFFVMGQEQTLLIYLSQYQYEPSKQSGLVRWIVRTTMIKTLSVLSIVSIALLFNITIYWFETPWIHGIQWLGFVSIPFVAICGIYERFFLFLKKFFISFISRGLFHPILLIIFLYMIQDSTPSVYLALSLYALAFVISTATSMLFGYYSEFSITKEYDQSEKRQWEISGIYYTVSTIIIKTTPVVPLYFLNHLVPGSSTIAFFVAMRNLIYGFHLLTKPFDGYLKPFIAKLYASNELDELQKTIDFVNVIRWVVIISLFTGLTLFSHRFLSAYGESYLQAQQPLVFFTFFTALQYLGQTAHELLNYTGHQKALSIIMTLQFFMMSFLCRLLIPTFDIWGAVIAVSVPCLIATISSSRYLYKKTKLKTYFFF